MNIRRADLRIVSTMQLGPTKDLPHGIKVDYGKPICEKCFRNVNPTKAIRCWVDINTFEITESATGNVWIGRDCWKRIKRENSAL